MTARVVREVYAGLVDGFRLIRDFAVDYPLPATCLVVAVVLVF